jgi:hypothetical protein
MKCEIHGIEKALASFGVCPMCEISRRHAADYEQGLADGIAQGRREAAEAWCAMTCPFKCPDRTCNQYKTILGTASDEKTDKGEI